MRGYLMAAISSASYGINALAPILYGAGYSTDSVLFYRYLFATVMLGIIAIVRKTDLRLSGHELLLVAPMGLLFALSSLSLFESYNYVGVSLAATVLFVYPALVALLLWLLYRERPTRITIISIPTVFVGIALLDINGILHGNSSWLGLCIVIASALSYSIYMIVVQKSCLSSMNPLKLSFYSLLFGMLLFVVRLSMNDGWQPIEGALNWSVVLALAFFPSLVSLCTMAVSIRLVGSTATAVLGAFEPITSVLIGVFLFSERPDLTAWLGMGIIILAVTVMVTQGRWHSILNKVKCCLPRH